jgi:polysaccharide biosynthesis protein PslG
MNSHHSLPYPFIFICRTFRTLAMATAVILLPHQSASAEPPDPRTDQSPWGIASGAEWAKEYPKFNPLLNQAGVRWLRFFPEWQTLEPKQGEFNWQSADDLIANCKANNIHVSGTFAYLAPWASADGSTRKFPIKDIKFWSNYVTAAVERYKGDIKYWEVYNEFNGSFAKATDKPVVYAELVKETYTAAKKADPTAMVGMSCANFDLGFFDAAIKAGAADHFDFVCVHPYENLGQLADGGEQGYLSMAASIRKMLTDNKQKADMPFWITETGLQAPVNPDPDKEALQAEILVKGYVLSIAAGFERICWFEARGPAYGKGTDHGIIRADWTLRPCYEALKNLSATLGAEPKYLGWLNLDQGGFGFVFQSPKGQVLVAWSPKAKECKLTFPSEVKVTDILGAQSSLATGKPLVLKTTPVFISEIPAALVSEAKDNLSKVFPWGGDVANATEVSCILGATNEDKGVSQIKQNTTQVVNMLDHSFRRSDIGNKSLKGEGFYAYFKVDPQFAPFGTKELEITVVAKRFVPDKPASFQITYESMNGYKGAGDRFEIPEGDGWSEHTWKVNNANFVGGWGWNFRTDAGGSPNDIVIKEVRVKKVEVNK